MTEDKNKIIMQLRKIVAKETISEHDLNVAGNLLDELYAESTEKDYLQGAKIVEKIWKIATDSIIPTESIARNLYGGMFICYYNLLKRIPEETTEFSKLSEKLRNDIVHFEIQLAKILFALENKEEILWGKYSYLISLVESQMRFNSDHAKIYLETAKKNKRASESLEVQLKIINADGLEKMSAGKFDEAVATFDQVYEYENEISQNPHTFQDFANIINNIAKSRIELAKRKVKKDNKINLLIRAIRGLSEAYSVYSKIPLKPKKHFGGLINRNIMAAIEWLKIGGYHTEAEDLQKIFGKGKTEECKNKIQEIQEKEDIDCFNYILKNIENARKAME